MLNFGCDYLEGAHEKILARFIETNMEKEPGYGDIVSFHERYPFDVG